MTSDLRMLLHEAAASPTTDADVTGAMSTARRRHRRRLGLGVGALAVVVAVVTVGVAATGGDGPSARVAIGPRQTSRVPDGWTPVELDSGIRFAMPPDWDVFDFGTVPTAELRIAIGTARPADTSVLSACTPEFGQVPTEAGTWVSLWEYPGVTGSEVRGPGGSEILGIVDRPADFRAGGVTGSCPFVGGAADGELGAAFEIFAFRDAGRVFVARVVTAHPTTASPNFDEADAVLNTLQIAPLEPTTTQPAATTTTTPAAAASTTVPFVPASADEQEISRVFVQWQHNNADDEIRALVEDADALLDAIHQGMAQHSEGALAGYSGRVESVQMNDAEHATVRYALLWNGQPQFGVRTGTAVKIDGVWKVSRDTECALLSLGGITCPPR